MLKSHTGGSLSVMTRPARRALVAAVNIYFRLVRSHA
jgi:hypothetical protein